MRPSCLTVGCVRGSRRALWRSIGSLDLSRRTLLRSSTPTSSSLEFQVVVADQGTTRTVTPVGDVDVATVPITRGPLSAALGGGFETVVLDLGQTTFLDSTGVRLVLEASARAQAGATRLIVLPGPPAVQRVFELCGVADLLLTGHDGHGRNRS